MNHSSDSNIATDTSRFATAGLILMIAALSTACTNEPARRSAVDPKRTCDPANPYSCLATRVTTGGGSPQQAAPSATNNGSNGAPTQTKVPPEELPPEELPPEELPGPSPVVDTSGERDVDAEKAKAIEKLTSAFEELGSAASTAIKNGGESKSGDSGDDSKLKPFLVTFSKDSFVGIATGSVTKNCAVTSGTVIEV
ncbi:MAG: hypothetical protein RJB13_779, partial [Pseudomonadota bacterium]